MLEKNRDNLAKMLPGAAKYYLTQGEIVSNGAYYNALDPEHLSRRRYCSRSSTTRSDSGAVSMPASRRTTQARGRRSRSPSTAFRSLEISPMMATRKRLVAGTAILLAILLIAGAAFLVRQVFFAPKTITAYFPTATAIYPGDEVRVSGVKVGTIDRIEPDGTQTKMTLKVDSRRAHPGRREGRDRRAEPRRGPLRSAHPGLPERRRRRPWATAR